MADSLPSTSRVRGFAMNKKKPTGRTIFRRINANVKVKKSKQTTSVNCTANLISANMSSTSHLPDGENVKVCKDKASTSEVVTDEKSALSCSPDHNAESPKSVKEFHQKMIRLDVFKSFDSAESLDKIIEDLKMLEIARKFNSDYMNKQLYINMDMRSVLVDWLIEIAESFKLHTETVHLAVSYLDRFLSNICVEEDKFQLVGVTCMLLASNFQEENPPQLNYFLSLAGASFTKVRRMESLILSALNSNLVFATPYAFQQLFCCEIKVSDTVIELSQYLCELSLLYGDPFFKFRASIIAAGSIALANYTLRYEMWDERHVKATGYELQRLAEVICCLYHAFKGDKDPGNEFKEIYKKYTKMKFGCASNLSPPQKLIFPTFPRVEMKKKTLRV